MSKTTCSTMATAPGRPPPKALVNAARTSKPLAGFGLRLGAGDFLRPAGFRAGDLARGLRGDAAPAAEALAARVATMVYCVQKKAPVADALGSRRCVNNAPGQGMSQQAHKCTKMAKPPAV